MRRKYHSSVALVVRDIYSASLQANSLAASGERLLTDGNHSLALSVAVLALEEIGKAMIIDGLVFAKKSDAKVGIFDRGLRKHTEKLKYVRGFPLYLNKQSIADPREEDDAFRRRIECEIEKFSVATENLSSILGGSDDFQILDRYKQRGFYTEIKSDMTFELPENSISLPLATSVVTLASIVAKASVIPFEVGVDWYIDFLDEIRGVMSEDQHLEIERCILGLFGQEQMGDENVVH